MFDICVSHLLTMSSYIVMWLRDAKTYNMCVCVGGGGDFLHIFRSAIKETGKKHRKINIEILSMVG